MNTKPFLVIILLFVVGYFLYVLPVVLTFRSELYSFSPFLLIFLNLIEGLEVLALGYGSVIILGGKLSLKLIRFIARMTRSTYVVEVIHGEPKATRKDFILFMPALVFLISVSLAWDIRNLHDPTATSVFHQLLDVLDIFSKELNIDPILHSLDRMPTMVGLVTIAGAVPSMFLPYFRRFKITGINTRPFHTGLLTTVVTLVAGLSVLLSMIGVVYQVLWAGKGPNYFHYILPTILGFSLHYSIGTFLGRKKSENMVSTMLETISDKRVVKGTVNIQVI